LRDFGDLAGNSKSSDDDDMAGDKNIDPITIHDKNFRIITPKLCLPKCL
jgi:hypothetical protein